MEEDGEILSLHASWWLYEYTRRTILFGPHFTDARGHPRTTRWSTDNQEYELLSDTEATHSQGALEDDAIMLPPSPQQIKMLQATLIPLFEKTGLLADLILVIARMCAY
jgi:hypothetical protein